MRIILPSVSVFVTKCLEYDAQWIEDDEVIFFGNLGLSDDNLCVNIAFGCGIMNRHD